LPIVKWSRGYEEYVEKEGAREGENERRKLKCAGERQGFEK
jgi:hypothetical protein